MDIENPILQSCKRVRCLNCSGLSAPVLACCVRVQGSSSLVLRSGKQGMVRRVRRVTPQLPVWSWPALTVVGKAIEGMFDFSVSLPLALSRPLSLKSF